MKFSAVAIPLLHTVTVAVALLTLAGCAISNREDDAFVGQPSSQLLATLGTPQLRAPDGKGGEIWTYIQQSGGNLSGPTFAGPMGPASGTMVNSGFTSKREFLIDSTGNVYLHRTRGL